jgi:hypothetical protein
MADLSDFWTAQKLALETKSTLLAGQLTALVAPEQAAVKAAGEVATKLGDAQTALDAIRGKLARIAMPADGDPLLVDLNTAVIALQQARQDQVAAEDALAQLRATNTGLRAEKQETDDLAAQAATRLKAAQTAKTQREGLKTALTTAPVKDFPATANTLAGSVTAVDAKKHVDDDFPPELLAQARARRAQAAAVQTRADAIRDAAQSADDTQNETSNRSTDKIPRLERALRVADAAADDYVKHAAGTLQAAKAVLERYAARSVSALTAAQKNHLFDAAQINDRKAALLEQSKRDAKAAELADAQADLDRAVLAEQAKDADYDVAAAKLDPAKLKPKQDVVDTKSGELVPLVAAYDFTAQKKVADWFAQVPDALWDDLAAVDGALASLATLTPATKPADLKAALDASETALLAEMQKLDKENRTVATRRRRLAAASAAADQEETASSTRAAAAVRGGV